LYTQCPECSTVFRITAEALRMAQGDVRCGICSAQFNALDSLRDAPTAEAADGTLPEGTMTVEETPGNELIDLSTATEETPGNELIDLSTATEAEAAVATDADGMTLREAAVESDDDAAAQPDDALEFHGTAEDAERLFVTESPDHLAEPTGGDESSQDDDILRAIDEISRADLSGIEVRESPLFEEGDPAGIAAALASVPTSATADHEPDGLDEVNPPDDSYQIDVQDPTDEVPVLVLEDGAARPEETPTEAPPRILIPAALRRDLAAASPSAAEELAAVTAHDQPPRSRGAIGLSVGALLVFALALQGVHFWRDTLARNPVAGPWILRAYAALDLPIDLPSDLAAFELRQWGATSDASQAGQLRLRASIVNRAAFAQPYPLLRLSLQDRFGNTIGVRDVAAGDYLPGGREDVPRLLAPQQRADAEIVFVDPGREAVGFELDVCLEGPSGVRCASALPGSRP
jgi:predicted Zn finger-like uncharacterized protein